MKKNCIIFILIGIISLTVVFFSVEKRESVSTEYLRIHVRANSNEEKDQQIKYQIKDRLVAYLTPFVAQASTKSQAISLLNEKSEQMESICNSYLSLKGFNYSAKVKIVNEYFPTRVYEDTTLESGYYDSIIVELGSAKGDNWWCVVYPPLCFVNSAPVSYRSKILEIINNFKNR